MLINNINLNHIRIFECVYRTCSMTKAAEELYMTQSGVSQHIRILEEMLDVPLFDRIKQRIIPTSAGRQLFEKCSQGLYQIEQALVEIKGDEQSLAGKIRLGIPIEFGNNIILPLLVDFAKKHPRISYHLEYGLSSTMNHLLLKGDLDFAIVDNFPMDRVIEVENLYEELLLLCCSENYLKGKKGSQDSKRYFESLDYVDFETSGPLTNAWFQHHFNAPNWSLHIRASLVDVQGMARMITKGLGVGILPDHQVEKLKKQNDNLHIFEGCGNPLVNKIGLATIRGKIRPPAVSALIDYLTHSLICD